MLTSAMPETLATHMVAPGVLNARTPRVSFGVPETRTSPTSTSLRRKLLLEPGGVEDRACFGSGRQRVDAFPVFALGGYNGQAVLLRQGTARAHKCPRGVFC